VGASPPTDDLVTTHQYDLFGDLFRTILPRGNLIEYGYDAAGRLISIERKPDAATHGERTFYTLDTFGHRTKEELQHWDGAAWVTDSFTDFVYSSRCHLDKTVNADGGATEYAYDCNGNLKDAWDANHPMATNPVPTQHYEYDFLNRVESVTQPWGGAGGGTAVTGYTYDVQDHLETVTDANGNVTTYTWSDRDLMTEEDSPVSDTTDSSYNEHGELVSQTDARGVTMIRTVDALDRVTFVDYPGSDLDTNYSYDDVGVPFSKGRLTSIARPGSTVDYEYDRFGRVTQDGALGFTYDKNGNRTNVAYAPTVALCYTYDFADRPLTLKHTAAGGDPCLGSSLVTSAAYKPFGPLTSLALGNSLTETRSFDSRYFPDRIQVPGQLDWDYTTDAVGNITSIADGVIPGGSRSFTYQDHQYFLTQGTGPWATLAWTYDKIGNRLTETQTGEPLPFTYSYSGTTPKLTQIQPRPHGSGSGSATYSYDAAGNQTTMVSSGLEGSGKTTTLTYSFESKLSHLATTPGVAGTDFLYDGRGFLRDVLLVYGGSGDFEHTEPTYGSEGLLYSRRWSRQSTFGTPQDDSPAPTITADETTHVFYFGDRPIAQLSVGGGGLTYLTADHLGTPVLATNTAGTTIWQGGFTPFGAPYQLMDPGFFLRLPGQWADSSWGGYGAELYYNLHRWYDAGIGRYTQVDPLGLAEDVSLYRYAGSRPTYFVDITGLSVRVCCNKIPPLVAMSRMVGIPAPRHCFFDFGGTNNLALHNAAEHAESIRSGVELAPFGVVEYGNSFDIPESEAQCGPWADGCVEQCVHEAAADYPYISLYLGVTSNSNTFVGTVERACPVKPPPSLEVLNAPGYFGHVVPLQ
jgi:RHS repeat-associated protein